MRIALLTVALAETIMAVAFGVEWLRDRRRPPGRRTFTRPYKLAVVLAAIVAVACFTFAFAVND
jgi:multisubunit Na+/H+ antiporter MnhB subunit